MFECLKRIDRVEITDALGSSLDEIDAVQCGHEITKRWVVMTVNVQKTVIIYCDHLLYSSETFIPSQASALKRFAPVYA